MKVPACVFGAPCYPSTFRYVAVVLSRPLLQRTTSMYYFTQEHRYEYCFRDRPLFFSPGT